MSKISLLTKTNFSIILFKHISNKFQGFKKIGINFLLLLAKIFISSKKILIVFFDFFLYKPVLFLYRNVFLKIIVRVYCRYSYIIRFLGFKKLSNNLVYYVFKKRLIHFSIFLLTIIVVFTNFTSKSRADVISEKAKNSIVASLVQSEFGDINNNDEELIEEYFDKNIAQSIANKNYLKNEFGLEEKQRVGFVDDYDLIYEDLDFESKEADKQEIKTQKRTKIIEYIVKAGDSISTIAQKFGISVNTILWENNLSVYSLIRPGDKLRILPFSGITHQVKSGENISFIARKYNIDQNELMKANKLSNANKLRIGQELLIPNGRKIYVSNNKKRSVRNTSYSGLSVIKNLVAPPSSKKITSNKMAWPTVGHRITQYYSWRHTGLDIANKIGTPLYAADAGVVEFAGWSRGYGYNVVINHGGGKKTRYAHCSKFYVRKGVRVKKGQTIAAMGSTGWSTGPHIHFEVIINGRRYNPLNYIK